MAYNIFEDYGKDELLALNYNFAFLELLDKDETYSKERGKRIERNFRKDGQLVIKEYYEYEFNTESDGKQRSVTRMTKKVNFYDGDGNIGLERVIKDVTDKYLLEEVNESIRQGRVRYLSSESKKIEDQIPFMPTAMPMQDGSTFNVQAHYTSLLESVAFVLSQYHAEASQYNSYGTMVFENAILNETDPVRLAHLNNLTILPGTEPKWPAGQTIKTALLHQLNGDVV